MNEPRGGPFAAAFRSWCLHLCLLKPPREGLETAIEALNQVFDDQSVNTPQQCSSKESEEGVQHDLKVVEAEAKGKRCRSVHSIDRLVV